MKMLGVVACICNPNTGEVKTGCLRVSTAVKSHHDHSNSLKEHIQSALVHSSRCLAHYHHDDKHGSTQAGMVLEKELRVLYLDSQAAGDCTPHWA